MINKLYEIIKQNIKFIVFLVVLFLLFYVKLPFYIDTGGGILNLNKRVSVDDRYESKGSFNLTYVSELDGNVIFVLFSLVNPNWDLIKKSDVVANNETIKETNYRNKMLLNEANSCAHIVAFTKALKDIKIKKSDLYITYVDENSKTDLKIGDKIIKVDNKSYTKLELKNYILSKSIGDKINIEVENNNKKYNRIATIINLNNVPSIGIILTEEYDIESNPKVTFKFKNSESGPSAGLMTSLEIYNNLIKEDITKGKVISGTGTIDVDGTVGSISGVEYKLKAANKKADIFFVPNGDNYEEAIKLKKQNNYKIKIIGVSSFEEAIKYLKNN